MIELKNKKILIKKSPARRGEQGLGSGERGEDLQTVASADAGSVALFSNQTERSFLYGQ